jgi:hypothetical protein
MKEMEDFLWINFAIPPVFDILLCQIVYTITPCLFSEEFAKQIKLYTEEHFGQLYGLS